MLIRALNYISTCRTQPRLSNKSDKQKRSKLEPLTKEYLLSEQELSEQAAKLRSLNLLEAVVTMAPS